MSSASEKEDMTVSIIPDKFRGSTEYFLVYSELVYAARYRGTTTYQAIAQLMGLPLTGNYMASQIGKVLGEISEDEVKLGRPMLSALAVAVNGVPGPGFYALARKLERLQEESKEAERAFWEQEKQALYATWQRQFG